VIDDDAVALVVERARENDGAAIRCPDHGANGGTEIHALVNAGELAVEGAAGAEAVGGWSVNRCAEGAGPKGFGGAGGEGALFEDAIGFDLFELVRAGRDKFRRHGEDAGAVVRGMDSDGLGEIAHSMFGEVDVDEEGGGAFGLLHIDTSEGKPGTVVAGGKELDFAAEPFTVD